MRPIFKLRRKVPFTAEASNNKELDCFEDISVLTKSDLSEWASPTIYVKNKNKTVFSTRLNDCMKTYLYLLPSSDYILAKSIGGKVFSKLDLSEAFFQIPADEECAKYLTIKG